MSRAVEFPSMDTALRFTELHTSSRRSLKLLRSSEQHEQITRVELSAEQHKARRVAFKWHVLPIQTVMQRANSANLINEVAVCGSSSPSCHCIGACIRIGDD